MCHAHSPSYLARRKRGYALERPFYTDPDIFTQDLEQVYYKEWIFVAPLCELPEVGSYLTYKVGDYQIIVVRSADERNSRLPQYLPP